MHKGILRVTTAIALVLSAATMTAQRKYEPHFAIGGKGGVTFSQMAFTPGIEQKMVQFSAAECRLTRRICTGMVRLCREAEV